MRLMEAALLAALPLAAQPFPAAIVRGQVLECDAEASVGELSLRTPAHQVFRFSFDTRTYFERENQRIGAAGLRKGDTIEIVSDGPVAGALRYARTVHVVPPEQPQRPRLSAGRVRLLRTNPIEQIAPSGNLTFSGLVSRINDQRLVLRTRSDGEKIIYFRADTRYLESGSPVTITDLKPNTRVFIRGSKNLDDEIEAYQVVWGEILDPQP